MTSIFKFLTEQDEAQLLGLSERRQYADEQVIVREGERESSLFILRSGCARVERAHGEFSVEMSQLQAGELFGEMGFVDEIAASASVIAQGACEVDLVEFSHVQSMSDNDPGFAGRFYRSIAAIISGRLRATSVDALSEFSWGTGSFARNEDVADTDVADIDEDGNANWGGGSPLRDD
jgi:CRP-like cAMP-binding protein